VCPSLCSPPILLPGFSVALSDTPSPPKNARPLSPFVRESGLAFPPPLISQKPSPQPRKLHPPYLFSYPQLLFFSLQVSFFFFLVFFFAEGPPKTIIYRKPPSRSGVYSGDWPFSPEKPEFFFSSGFSPCFCPLEIGFYDICFFFPCGNSRSRQYSRFFLSNPPSELIHPTFGTHNFSPAGG